MNDLVRVVAAGDTHIGRREHNEDALLLRRELNLFALADGAGAEAAGNIASNLALATIAHRMEATQDPQQPAFDVLGIPTAARRLSAAVHRANSEIVQLSKGSPRYTGMGTTVVAAHVDAPRAVMHLAHVGDSRCYRLRAGLVELLTQDHSLINDVLELTPELPDEKAKALPTRVVTRALGMNTQLRVAMQSVALSPGDRFLFCSDGLTDELDEEQIADALRQDLRPDAMVKLLLEVAHAPQAQDNIAILVLDIRGAQEGDWPQPALRARPEALRGTTLDLDDADDPELVIEGSASVAPSELPPSEEVDEDVADGLGDLPTTQFAALSPEEASQVLLSPPKPGPEREATLRFERRCPNCNALFDGPKGVCPFCWDND